MIGALINLLVLVLICGLVWWAFNAILGIGFIPEPLAQIARVLVIVILCLILIYALLGFVPGGYSGFRLR
jgi:uncharacterized membrane protein YwzB